MSGLVVDNVKRAQLATKLAALISSRGQTDYPQCADFGLRISDVADLLVRSEYGERELLVFAATHRSCVTCGGTSVDQDTGLSALHPFAFGVEGDFICRPCLDKVRTKAEERAP